ncbi:MAG TPA: hypothetical protein VEC19_02965 [Usitatibacter sp.]|nr:hypothetical protein [Usitatibacter sp.]
MELIVGVFVIVVLWLGVKALATLGSEPKSDASRGGAKRVEATSKQSVLDSNIGWLRERWVEAETAKAAGALSYFPKWFFDPATDKQLTRLQRMGVRLSGGELTKGAASDIIGLFEDPESSDMDVLKFFKMKLSPEQKNETRVRHEISKLFQDPEKLTAWRGRPADGMQKEFYRFFSLKIPSGLTYEEAETTIREADIPDAEFDAWRDFENVCDELADRSTLEDYGLRKPSLPVIRAAYDDLRKTAPKDANDPMSVAEKILQLKPELARER